MEATLPTTKRISARLAASIFFLLCVPLSIWDQFYVPSVIFVPQDPAATATNLLANEFIFRTSIISHLLGFLAFAFMMLLFARIFRPVDKNLSRLMEFSVLAQVAVVFIFEVFNLTALMVLKGAPRLTLDLAQQQEVVYLFMRMQRTATGAGMGKFFIGLSFIPFGVLVFRSGFAPRIIGIMLIIGGVGYVADCCIAILLQRPDYLAARSALIYTVGGYFMALLWFVIKGVRDPKAIKT